MRLLDWLVAIFNKRQKELYDENQKLKAKVELLERKVRIVTAELKDLTEGKENG